jgi:hypothetical protein
MLTDLAAEILNDELGMRVNHFRFGGCGAFGRMDCEYSAINGQVRSAPFANARAKTGIAKQLSSPSRCSTRISVL